MILLKRQLSLMNKKTLFLLVAGLFVAVFLAGCGLTLAQDVTPPPGAESYTALDTPEAVEAVFPLVPPDPGEGKLIFNEKCASCHGATGLGDGAQADELPVPVSPLGDANLADAARPMDWFLMVTNGNLERYMPGFSSLDDRQRWDVVAYALTLSMDADEIEQGSLVYEQRCQMCHGESGQGSIEAPNWMQDAARLASYSIDEMIAMTAEGVNAMPGFTGDLSQAEIRAASIYTRALSFGNFVEPRVTIKATTQVTPEPDVAPEAAAASLVTFQGRVTNVSGGELPQGLQAVLNGFEDMNQVLQQNVPVEDGLYRFDSIEITPGQIYLVTIDYQEMTFSSDAYHAIESPAEQVIELPVDFYETTTDTSVLSADRMHIFFDFANPEVVQVVELFILNNSGDRVIIAEEAGMGVVQYDLPEGAANLQFEEGALGDRYILTDKGFADTAAIEPGSGQQILFAYEVPYENKMTLTIPIPMNVFAAVVMVPQGAITLQSDQLSSTGQRDVQGVNLDLYTASALAAGSSLAMQLSSRGSSRLSLPAGTTSGLVIGGAALVVVLIGAGYWLLRKRKPKFAIADDKDLASQETVEDLMDAIIALDDRYKAGDLPEEAYLSRRDELKERLRTRMQ